MGRLIGTSTQYSFLPTVTFTNAYGYDAASNRTSFTAPDGTTNTYQYDTLNRLATLTSSLTGQFSFGYDADSRRTSLGRPNGVSTGYSYDSLSHLLSVLHQSGGSTVDGETYTYDAAGNRTSKANQLNSVTEQYAYDAIYELLQVTANSNQGSTTTESCTYDAVGNRLTALTVPQLTYNSSNELTSTSSTSYTYDSNGNMMSKADSSGTTQYGWDFENRLTSAALPGTGGTVTFKYDPFGRRIQKLFTQGTTSTTTNYLYDGANLIDEVGSSANNISNYTYAGLDEPVAVIRSGVASFYQKDGINSVTSLTNSLGALTDEYTFAPFGKLKGSSGSTTNPFRYAGREFDQETGLYYMGARYYDSAIGRFLTEDPLQLNGGDTNLYAYVGNGPTNFIDPSGLVQRTPRIGPPNTDVFFPDPHDPNEGTIRVYGPNGEAVTDYDFGHDHTGAGNPHAHDWKKDKSGKPYRGKPRKLRPNECVSNPETLPRLAPGWVCTDAECTTVTWPNLDPHINWWLLPGKSTAPQPLDPTIFSGILPNGPLPAPFKLPELPTIRIPIFEFGFP